MAGKNKEKSTTKNQQASYSAAHFYLFFKFSCFNQFLTSAASSAALSTKCLYEYDSEYVPRWRRLVNQYKLSAISILAVDTGEVIEWNLGPKSHSQYSSVDTHLRWRGIYVKNFYTVTGKVASMEFC